MYLAGGRRMGSTKLSYRDGVPGTGRSEAQGHVSTSSVCRPVVPLRSPTGTGPDARQSGRGIGGEGRPNHPPPDGSDGFVVELSSRYRYRGSGRGYPSLAIGCAGSQRLYGHPELRAFVLVVRHARPEWMGVKKTGRRHEREGLGSLIADARYLRSPLPDRSCNSGGCMALGGDFGRLWLWSPRSEWKLNISEDIENSPQAQPIPFTSTAECPAVAQPYTAVELDSEE
ncbi:hypothetical protein L227DRAFT_439613 [Lentinus tigrinus ALCF2SS1-6]|uniref:Uncharacterized protein n=1 Tax=Lentinus tigrinus ALCF2SS1-6 TaxID=1328759 RepID=A0A5C2RMH3_9APHY|nr:hypothetical protein L227DRAFT_439613 [Lentinus tigrinus ALCF2SS1-6]